MCTTAAVSSLCVLSCETSFQRKLALRRARATRPRDQSGPFFLSFQRQGGDSHNLPRKKKSFFACCPRTHRHIFTGGIFFGPRKKEKKRSTLPSTQHRPCLWGVGEGILGKLAEPSFNCSRAEERAVTGDPESGAPSQSGSFCSSVQVRRLQEGAL